MDITAIVATLTAAVQGHYNQTSEQLQYEYLLMLQFTIFRHLNDKYAGLQQQLDDVTNKIEEMQINQKNKISPTRSKAEPSDELEQKILGILSTRIYMKAADIADKCGLPRLKSEVNPTLYRMLGKGLVKKRSTNSSDWKLLVPKQNLKSSSDSAKSSQDLE